MIPLMVTFLNELIRPGSDFSHRQDGLSGAAPKRIAAMFSVVFLFAFVVESTLVVLMTSNSIQESPLPLGARSFLLAYRAAILAVFVFAIVSSYESLGRFEENTLTSGGAIPGAMRLALTILFFLCVFLYVVSWVAFWQTGKFLDHHTIAYWISHPIQVFHWTEADVVLAIVISTMLGVLLFGRWIPSWARRLHIKHGRLLALTCNVFLASCFFWAMVGELYSNRGVHRHFHQSGLYAPSRDDELTPFAHLVGGLRKLLWSKHERATIDDRIQVDSRPIITVNEYLASADLAKWKKLNIVFLMIESLRADQLRDYGANRDVMPTLESLASEARLFTDTYTQASHTDYAVLAPLSSHYPLQSATRHTYPRNPTYPRVLIYDLLKAVGYKTALISSSNENWSGMINYHQIGNIDYLFHAPLFKGPSGENLGNTDLTHWMMTETRSAGSVDDRYTVKEAIEWIDQQHNQPFFVYLNFQNSHLPYHVPEDFPRRFSSKGIGPTIRFGYFPKDKVDAVKDIYADSLAYVDAQIAQLFQYLRRKGLWEKTLIIVTGDHGQAFYEHGFAAHGSRIYNEVMKVPLIFRAPGLEAARDHRPAQHIDVPPSILSVLGLPPHPSFQGISLFDPAAKAQGSRYMVAQTPLSYQYGIVRERWKLIYDEWKRSYLLYDLVSDPGEKQDLAKQNPEIVRDLARRLNTWRTHQVNYYSQEKLHTRQYPPIFLD